MQQNSLYNKEKFVFLVYNFIEKCKFLLSQVHPYALTKVSFILLLPFSITICRKPSGFHEANHINRITFPLDKFIIHFAFGNYQQSSYAVIIMTNRAKVWFFYSSFFCSYFPLLLQLERRQLKSELQQFENIITNCSQLRLLRVVRFFFQIFEIWYHVPGEYAFNGRRRTETQFVANSCLQENVQPGNTKQKATMI